MPAMTVAELVERLQALPGASESRFVWLAVSVHRDKRPTVEGEIAEITSVRNEHDKVIIEGWGWEENSCG